MTTRRIIICDQRYFSLDGRGGQTQTIEIARKIPSDWIVSGVFLARYYSRPAAWVANTRVDVFLYNSSPADDDPATVYTPSTSNASLPILDTTNPPTLVQAALTAPVGPFFRVLLVHTVPAGSAASTQFTIGLEIIGRDA